MQMMGAELYFAPRVVRSGNIGSTKACQEEINNAIAVKKALRTSKRIQKLTSRAARKVQPGDATVDAGALSPQDREIRETQRDFIKNCDWWRYAGEEQQESVLQIIVMLRDGRVTPAEYRVAIKSIAEIVRGPKISGPQYYRPEAHPWKLSGGW
jgi:hypothetical protein